MTPLYLAVHIVAKPGQESALRQALEALVAPSRADDGCMQYDLHVDRDTPARLFFYEAWRDEAAWQAHDKAAHLVRFRQDAGALIDSITIHQLTRI
jgi:quinol monooxygenase YgiN